MMNPSIDLQVEKELELETTSIELSVHKYREKYQKDKSADKNLTFFQPERKLVMKSIEPLAEKIENFQSWPDGIQNSIKEIDEFDLAYIIATYCVNSISRIEPINRTYAKLGEMIPPQIDYSRLKALQPKYLESIKSSWQSKRFYYGTKSLSNALHKFGIKPAKWDRRTCLNIGSVLINMFIESTGLFEIKKWNHHQIFQPLDEVLDWLEKAHVKYETHKPKFLPMIAKPEPWHGVYIGGYLTNTTDMKLKIIKSRRLESIAKLGESETIPIISAALNVVQETPWRINRRILDVMKHCAENDMVGLSASKDYEVWLKQKSKRNALKEKLWLAEKFKNEPEIYFVWNMGWRGRIYPVVPYLNPQGDELCKSLLKFARGKSLGDRGWYWLAVHGANCFGKNKLSFEEQIQYIRESESFIIDSAQNPF
jgi:DNA-directed RNA polymerase